MISGATRFLVGTRPLATASLVTTSIDLWTQKIRMVMREGRAKYYDSTNQANDRILKVAPLTLRCVLQSVIRG